MFVKHDTYTCTRIYLYCGNITIKKLFRASLMWLQIKKIVNETEIK